MKTKQLFLYVLHIAHLTSEILGQCHNISQQIIKIWILITNLCKYKNSFAVITSVNKDNSHHTFKHMKQI